MVQRKLSPQHSAWFDGLNLLAYSKVSLQPFHLFHLHFTIFLSSDFEIVPRAFPFPAHSSFRSGPNFRNHRTCRAWMGARLPCRNTYQKGIYPFLGQTRYYAPDENGGLLQWADPLTAVTYSLSPGLEPSPRHPHVLFLSLYIFTFSSSMVLY